MKPICITLPLRIVSVPNQRVLKRLENHSVFLEETGCFIWNGDRVKAGHGRIHMKEGLKLVHRVSYVLFVGDIPTDKIVMHKCDVPNCWNPNHLRVGTQLENIKDRDSKGRTARGVTHARLKGEENGASRLNEKQVRAIRKMYAQGNLSQSEIAHLFGIGQMTVSSLVRRKTWKHVR